MKTCNLAGHDACIELTSGAMRIGVTTAVGPRVIFGSVAGSANLFQTVPVLQLPGVETGWQIYGGHRLWHAPEANPRSYAPDNAPVTVAENGDYLCFSSGVEALTGIEKSISIKPLGNERFELVHRLTNRNQWSVALAPWALSVMAQGGQAVIPFRAHAEACPYVVDRSLNLWAYSDITDPRLTLGRDFVILRQDPAATGPCKIGLNCAAGWVAYVNAGVALVKHMAYDAAACYPDNGCNLESYSCDQFCEIETLGPMHHLGPGAEAVHVEIWQGLSDVGDVSDDAAIAANLEPRVSRG